jgi:hypothetical protein
MIGCGRGPTTTMTPRFVSGPTFWPTIRPIHSLYRATRAEFWQHYYSIEMLSVRDQPLWNYFVAKWQLRPLYLRLFDDGDDAAAAASRDRRPHVRLCAAERSGLICGREQQEQQQQAAAIADCEALTTNGRHLYPFVQFDGSDAEQLRQKYVGTQCVSWNVFERRTSNFRKERCSHIVPALHVNYSLLNVLPESLLNHWMRQRLTVSRIH